jgi:gas vesicle protein
MPGRKKSGYFYVLLVGHEYFKTFRKDAGVIMKVFLVFLAGFALGIAAGLILAPQSGEATRAQLSEQGIMLRDRSAGLTGEIRARATNAVAQGRDMYARTKGELTESYTQAKTGQE